MSTLDSLTDIASARDYLNRIGAEARSMRLAIVRDDRGPYWKDLATIRFAKDGTVTCTDPAYEPTTAEANAIAVAFSAIQWPEIRPLKRLGTVPWRAAPKDAFEFRNGDGDIVMVQVRVEKKTGGKTYLPYTYWTDDLWRCAEPEGDLPLYNAHRLGEAGVVWIHEGAKSARYCQWMADGETREAKDALAKHPWGKEISGALHLGWIGGALNPGRTDWSEIKRHGIKRAYLVADNDMPGLDAIPHIAKELRCLTFCVRFNDEFPRGFDLADEFPRDMFTGNYYTGPTFRQCLDPATWMTDMVPTKSRGRPVAVLRESAKEMWAYCEAADLYVCKEMPTRRRSADLINKTVYPFSDVYDSGKLLAKTYANKSVGVCYRPDHPGSMVSYQDSHSINLHVRPDIKPDYGDVSPWEEFLTYLVPNSIERHELKRWCATLIARPEVRMGYALLLVSETQGIGKTTLGEHVLKPLVGSWNTGHPSEQDVTGNYNSWLAHRRLVLIGEIYSGSSWKAYNTLKASVTDHTITVSEKYTRAYDIENWAHIIACSNSKKALKMDDSDRRWFYPRLTEDAWPTEKFVAFREWLKGGGLALIAGWAEEFGDYVKPSQIAPMTVQKKEMIDDSRSEALKEANAIGFALSEWEQPAAIIVRDVSTWVKDLAKGGKIYESDYQLKKAMREGGLSEYSKRIKIGSRLEYVMLNKPLRMAIAKDLRANDPDEPIINTDRAEMISRMHSEIKKHLVRCSQVMREAAL